VLTDSRQEAFQLSKKSANQDNVEVPYTKPENQCYALLVRTLWYTAPATTATDGPV